jgi:alcohol dehydrogenase class IV
VIDNPTDLGARGETLYGAWLCGTVLGQVGMALHHKLCHTLGGSFDLPHAETHAVVLPHAIAYNARGSGTARAGHRDLRRRHIPVAALFDFARSMSAPLALRTLESSANDLESAAELATRKPYWNPQPVTRPAIDDLLAGRLGRQNRRPHRQTHFINHWEEHDYTPHTLEDTAATGLTLAASGLAAPPSHRARRSSSVM